VERKSHSPSPAGPTSNPRNSRSLASIW
jgi:hypothetical protein